MLSFIFEFLADIADGSEDSTLLSSKVFGFFIKLWFIILPIIYIAILILQIVTNGFGVGPFIGALIATVLIVVAIGILVALLTIVETLAKHVATLLLDGCVYPDNGFNGLLESVIDGLFTDE